MGMNWADSDLRYMRTAIAEAEKAKLADEIPVGAIVVWYDEIIGRGHNRSIQDVDPTAHAEINAIRNAASHRQNYRLNGATVYVTLEPCAMCVGAMIEARVQRLVFGAYDPKAGAIDALDPRMEINGGLLQDECSAILQAFFATKR